MDKQAMERRHLAEADQHIEEAEVRIARQKALIAELATDGHDTREAEKLLGIFITTLNTMQEHRGTILRELSNM